MTETASIPAAETAAGAFAHVDPQTLFIGDNVRDIADLDEDFIDSIRQCRFRFPLANAPLLELHVPCVSGQGGERVFPLFVANPRTVRLCRSLIVVSRLRVSQVAAQWPHPPRYPQGYTGSSKLTGQVLGGESGAGPLGAGAVEAYPAA